MTLEATVRGEGISHSYLRLINQPRDQAVEAEVFARGEAWLQQHGYQEPRLDTKWKYAPRERRLVMQGDTPIAEMESSYSYLRPEHLWRGIVLGVGLIASSAFDLHGPDALPRDQAIEQLLQRDYKAYWESQQVNRKRKGDREYYPADNHAGESLTELPRTKRKVRLSRRVTIRLSDVEYEDYERQAKRAGKKLSKFLRQAMKDDADLRRALEER